MEKGRLEAFSDGVIAILITIMVLEFKTPEGVEWAALRPLIPKMLSYVLSYIFLGIYWNNHHHMLQASHRVNGKVLWANLHLLFWLSLVPFVTSWMGENHFAPLPTSLYGVVLIMAAIAYTILQLSIVRLQGPNSKLAAAVGDAFKERASLMIYAVAIVTALLSYPHLAAALYFAVALWWFVPDRRIEKRINQ